MKLIVGLGNPGKEYQNTRHNAGFNLVNKLADKFTAAFSFNKKINADLADIKIKGKKAILLKPMTFMNNSGESVVKAVKYFKAKTEDIILVHDDKDILAGEYRLQKNRGSAGHNGVESVVNALKTKDFYRLRIGIAPKKLSGDTAEFVLKRFTKNDIKLIDKISDELIDAIISFF